MNGAFKVMVYLNQNSTNTLTVSADDLAGNIGTGSIDIVESAATDDYTGALDVTAADLQYIATVAGTPTSASSVNIQTPITFHPSGSIRVTLPSGTIISETAGDNFDATALVAASAEVHRRADRHSGPARRRPVRVGKGHAQRVVELQRTARATC